MVLLGVSVRLWESYVYEEAACIAWKDKLSFNTNVCEKKIL